MISLTGGYCRPDLENESDVDFDRDNDDEEDDWRLFQDCDCVWG